MTAPLTPTSVPETWTMHSARRFDTVQPRRPRDLALAAVALPLALAVVSACRDAAPTDRLRASGHVEATEIRLAPEVGGRLVELKVDEGSRVAAGDVVARLDTTDTELALARARAERAAADAQLRLLLAGARQEDIRQAQAQVSAGEAETVAAHAELAAARTDLQRFDDLLAARAGSRKQRDDAATRVSVAEGRVKAAEEQVRAGGEAVRRLQAGARAQEIDGARARLAAVDAQIATLDEAVKDATIAAPSGGIVTEKLVEPGELVAPRTPILVLTDLDHAWANIYIGEQAVPQVRLGQSAIVHTDAGGQAVEGRISYISPKAEFTPRNVQTAEERSKLVYRIKISVDNREGVLKPGMPVEAEIPFASAAAPPAGK